MKLEWDARDWAAGALAIRTLDAHAAGEPLRIITGGLPELPGATMLERRRYMREHLDHVRRALMWEPRGHYDMSVTTIDGRHQAAICSTWASGSAAGGAAPYNR